MGHEDSKLEFKPLVTDTRKVDDRSGTGYYLSGAIQTCWMNADHRTRFKPTIEYRMYNIV